MDFRYFSGSPHTFLFHQESRAVGSLVAEQGTVQGLTRCFSGSSFSSVYSGLRNQSNIVLII